MLVRNPQVGLVVGLMLKVHVLHSIPHRFYVADSSRDSSAFFRKCTRDDSIFLKRLLERRRILVTVAFHGDNAASPLLNPKLVLCSASYGFH